MDEIYDLFRNNITLIDMLEKAISAFRVQNFDKALRNTTSIIDRLNSSIELIEKNAGADRLNLLLNYLNDILQAQSSRDYVLLADLLELQLQSFFIELQNDIIHSGMVTITEAHHKNNLIGLKQWNPALEKLISADLEAGNLEEKGYTVEFSSCGLPTLAITDDRGKYYLHSNGQISGVACALANSWYQEEINEYVVYGFGLGYHIKELAGLDDSITIKVFEADINVLRLAARYTNMDYATRNKNLEIIYDPDFNKLFQRLQNLSDYAKFLIHHPSLRGIKDSAIREKLENYFLQYSSIENQRRLLNGNFRENIQHYDGFADDLKEQFQGKELYIVAAGPSLDKNFLRLKDLDRTKSIILATGTVFRKLMNAGITPDYVIVTDANPRVYHQIAGYENSSVPMLYLSSASKSFAQNYKGRKYIICQRDFDKAEDFAREKNLMLFQTGGSVSTTALDIGISLGCERILFLGLDLAFTDHYVHAADTSRRELASTQDLRQIIDINGNQIYTSKSLDIYRQWIENRIRQVKGIEFIDATEGGARIEGMKIMKLSECI